jgi:hypothetical protein
MKIFEIEVPDNKVNEVKAYLSELDVKIKDKKKNTALINDTIEAMIELKAGKGQSFKSVEELFNSI